MKDKQECRHGHARVSTIYLGNVKSRISQNIGFHAPVTSVTMDYGYVGSV